MRGASLADSSARGVTGVVGAIGIVVLALALGWFAGATTISLMVYGALGAVALAGIILTPSILAAAVAMFVPFTGPLAAAFVGVLAGNTTFTDAAMAAFVVAAFARPAKGSGVARLPVLPLALGFVFVVMAAGSMLANPNPSQGVFKVGRIVLAALVLLAAARSLRARDAVRCSRLVVIATSASCVLAFVVTALRASTQGASLRLWGGWVDPNYFGVLVAMVLLLALVSFPTKSRALWGTMLGILLFAEFATLSRAGALSLVVGLVILVVASGLRRAGAPRIAMPSRLLPFLLVFTGMLVAVMVLAPGQIDRALGRLEEGTHPTTDQSGQFRVQALDAGMTLLQQNPLTGTGPGTFKSASLTTGMVSFDNGIEAHDSLLEATVELGVLAGVCLAGLMAWAVFAGARTIRRLLSAGDPVATVAVGSWAALVAGIAGSFTLSNFLYEPTFLLICMILVGAASSSARGPQERTSLP